MIEKAGVALSDAAPWAGGGASLGEALLEPTRIYVNDVLKLHETVRLFCKQANICQVPDGA